MIISHDDSVGEGSKIRLGVPQVVGRLFFKKRKKKRGGGRCGRAFCVGFQGRWEKGGVSGMMGMTLNSSVPSTLEIIYITYIPSVLRFRVNHFSSFVRLLLSLF